LKIIGLQEAAVAIVQHKSRLRKIIALDAGAIHPQTLAVRTVQRQLKIDGLACHDDIQFAGDRLGLYIQLHRLGADIYHLGCRQVSG